MARGIIPRLFAVGSKSIKALLTVTIRLGFPQPKSSNYALSAFNESESEKLPQVPPLKFDSASFGGISQNRK